MRVAFNATSLTGPLTGVGQYAFQLARCLQTMPGMELSLFYADHFERSVHARGQRYVAEMRGTVRRFVPYAYEIARRLRQRRFDRGARGMRFDLYHEPNFLAFDFDGPLVLTAHDLSWIRYPETHPSERVRAMHKYFEPGLRRAQVVLTDSDFVKREIVDVFGIDPARIRAIPIGLDPIFRPMAREAAQPVLAAHGLSFGRYLLNVGTLEPRKNLERTVRAYGTLPAPLRADFPLVIVGANGWRAQGIESMLGPLVARGDAKVLGYLERSELAAVTAGAAALVYPSIYEGFGLPPLEAMGCGVPAISSNVSSLPEVVGDAGLLVDPLDIDAIAAAMRTMLEDTGLRSSLAAKSLERAARFTWEGCAAATFAAYRDAVASSR
jgi:glycosyltransferase involved in cell wall biosynthesis